MRSSQDTPRRISSNLGSLAVLAALEELLVLLDVKVISSRKVTSGSKFESKLSIVKRVKDVGDERGFVDADAEDLTLLVDTNDTIRGFVFSRYEDCLARNSVHVNADTALEIVEVNETVLGDQIDDSVFLRDLHRYREVVVGFWREVYVDSLLGERRVWVGVVNLDDV